MTHNIWKIEIKSTEHGKFKLGLIGHLINNKYWITCKVGTTYQSIAPPIPICNSPLYISRYNYCCTQINYMHYISTRSECDVIDLLDGPDNFL